MRVCARARTYLADMTGTKFLHCVQALSGYAGRLDFLAFVGPAHARRDVPSDHGRRYLRASPICAHVNYIGEFLGGGGGRRGREIRDKLGQPGEFLICVGRTGEVGWLWLRVPR